MHFEWDAIVSVPAKKSLNVQFGETRNPKLTILLNMYQFME